MDSGASSLSPTFAGRRKGNEMTFKCPECSQVMADGSIGWGYHGPCPKCKKWVDDWIEIDQTIGEPTRTTENAAAGVAPPLTLERPSIRASASVPGPTEPFPIEIKTILTGHTATVRSVSFSPDGTRLASAAGAAGDHDNTVRLWDPKTGQQLHLLKGHEDEISCLCFSPDGKVLASVEEVLIAWNPVDGTALWATRDKSRSRFVCVCYSPDGRTMACGLANAVIRVWTAESGTHVCNLEGHTKGVKCVRYSPDSKLLASASFDSTVRLWEAGTGKQLRVLLGHRDAVRSLSYSPNAEALASASDDKTIRLWDIATGRQLRLFDGSPSEVRTVEYSPDGRTIATGGSDGIVSLWDVTDGRRCALLKCHTSSVNSISFSPDGRLLASGSSDKTIRIWRVA